jgi:hypothetical protein
MTQTLMKLGFSLKFGEEFAKCLGPETGQQPCIRFMHTVKIKVAWWNTFKGDSMELNSDTNSSKI